MPPAESPDRIEEPDVFVFGHDGSGTDTFLVANGNALSVGVAAAADNGGRFQVGVAQTLRRISWYQDPTSPVAITLRLALNGTTVQDVATASAVAGTVVLTSALPVVAGDLLTVKNTGTLGPVLVTVSA